MYEEILSGNITSEEDVLRVALAQDIARTASTSNNSRSATPSTDTDDFSPMISQILETTTDEDGNVIYLIADTGLLVSLLDEEAGEDLRANRNLGVYKGALYENIVAEALTKSGYSLYYYKREDSTLEEDFFIRSQECLIPVEVKSKTGKAKSLSTLISSDKYSDIQYGFKLSHNNIGYSDKIFTFPYFCAFLLKRFMKKFKPEDFLF